MLSTPPAFILSQDQTLKLKFFSCQSHSGIDLVFSKPTNSFKSICLIGIFLTMGCYVVYLLFSFQGSNLACTVLLALLPCLYQRNLSYHVSFCLSTLFLNFFYFFFSSFIIMFFCCLVFSFDKH